MPDGPTNLMRQDLNCQLNWGAFDHASHASQSRSRSCNYYIHTALMTYSATKFVPHPSNYSQICLQHRKLQQLPKMVCLLTLTYNRNESNSANLAFGIPSIAMLAGDVLGKVREMLLYGRKLSREKTFTNSIMYNVHRPHDYCQ